MGKAAAGLGVLLAIAAWHFSGGRKPPETPKAAEPVTVPAAVEDPRLAGPAVIQLPQARTRAALADPGTKEEPAPGPQTVGDLDWHRLPLIGRPVPSGQWEGWVCADLDDSTHRSLWYREESPDATVQIYQGTCAEWENRPSEFIPPQPDDSIFPSEPQAL